MAKGKVFNYRVLYHPKEKRDPAGNVTESLRSEIIAKGNDIVANDDREVAMLAARAIPEEFIDRLSDIEVCVNSF